MRRRTWNPATDLTLPLDTAEPAEFDVVGLFVDAPVYCRGLAVMAKTYHRGHRYRALGDVGDMRYMSSSGALVLALGELRDGRDLPWPLPNLMLGTTIRTQAEADKLLPMLAAMPARWRFVRVAPSEDIDLRHAYACGGKPVCGGCGHRHGSDPSTGEINNRCWHGGQGLCPCRTWRMPLDLVEVVGGTGPKLVQARAQQVLDAQNFGHMEMLHDGPIWRDELVSGPALAIVADTCDPVSSCDCRGDDAGQHHYILGHGMHTNQAPIGWLS
jgi:hypothetical protein